MKLKIPFCILFIVAFCTSCDEGISDYKRNIYMQHPQCSTCFFGSGFFDIDHDSLTVGITRSSDRTSLAQVDCKLISENTPIYTMLYQDDVSDYKRGIFIHDPQNNTCFFGAGFFDINNDSLTVDMSRCSDRTYITGIDCMDIQKGTPIYTMIGPGLSQNNQPTGE